MPGPSQQELEVLQRGASPENDPGVLSRLHEELRRRLRTPDPKAFEYFEAAVKALRAIQSPGSGTIRAQCLLEACQFYYVFGRVFSAIEPARDAVQLARKLSDPTLLRRAINTLGILYADTG